MPTISLAQIVSRVSRGVLDLALSPWITTFTPGENDFGVDGEVRLTEYIPGKLNAEVLPLSFQFQLKAESNLPSPSGVARIGVRSLQWLLRLRMPIVLFYTPIDVIESKGLVYWRGVDSTLVEDLNSRNSSWASQDSVGIPFDVSDRFVRTDRSELTRYVKMWKPIDTFHGVP